MTTMNKLLYTNHQLCCGSFLKMTAHHVELPTHPKTLTLLWHQGRLSAPHTCEHMQPSTVTAFRNIRYRPFVLKFVC